MPGCNLTVQSSFCRCHVHEHPGSQVAYSERIAGTVGIHHWQVKVYRWVKADISSSCHGTAFCTHASHHLEIWIDLPEMMDERDGIAVIHG